MAESKFGSFREFVEHVKDEQTEIPKDVVGFPVDWRNFAAIGIGYFLTPEELDELVSKKFPQMKGEMIRIANGFIPKEIPTPEMRKYGIARMEQVLSCMR